MLLSGFTFIRNAVKYDFPIVECIESMLPLVDELVVNVGASDDGTEDLITSLKSPKIRVVRSVWDDSKTDKGLVLSEQTNLALEACRGRWCLYLQADEALHENEHAAIRRAVEEADAAAAQAPAQGTVPAQAPAIDGFRLRYLHFYGGYTLVQRPWNWYPAEIRIVRRDSGARSFGDAQTFRIGDRELRTKLLDAHVFHYGHARAPERMAEKIRYFHRFWHGDHHGIRVEQAYQLDWKNLVWYWGAHPSPYRARVQKGLSWSPKPSKLCELSAFKSVTIFAAHDPLDLADQLRKIVADAGGPEVFVARDMGALMRAPQHDAALVDLNAEEHSAIAFSALGGFVFPRFKLRVAHAPEGTLSALRRRFYNNVSWSGHETADQGFKVPWSKHAEQLARWLGIERSG